MWVRDYAFGMSGRRLTRADLEKSGLGASKELPSPFQKLHVRKEFLDEHFAGAGQNAPKECDKDMRKCLSGSLCLLRIDKYLLASQNIWSARSRTKQPKDTDVALQRDHVLDRKPRNRGIISGKQGRYAPHERCG